MNGCYPKKSKAGMRVKDLMKSKSLKPLGKIKEVYTAKKNAPIAAVRG